MYLFSEEITEGYWILMNLWVIIHLKLFDRVKKKKVIHFLWFKESTFTHVKYVVYFRLNWPKRGYFGRLSWIYIVSGSMEMWDVNLIHIIIIFREKVETPAQLLAPSGFCVSSVTSGFTSTHFLASTYSWWDESRILSE